MFAGLAAFLQITALPGAAILSLSGYSAHTAAQRLSYTFAISLLFNYLFVSATSALGIYTPVLVWILIATEIAIVARALLRSRPIRLDGSIRKSWRVVFVSILGTGTILLFMMFWYRDLGSVFTLWDDVVSWDRWAVEWYEGRRLSTGLYPQLIPANWSLAYMLTGNIDIKAFHKAVMPLFPILTLVILADFDSVWPASDGESKTFSWLANGLPSGAGPLAAFICGWLYLYIYDVTFIVSGYVDLALAFFTALTIYAWSDSRWKSDSAQLSWIRTLAPAVFAAEAMSTKQGGIFLLAAVGLLGIRGFKAAIENFTRRKEVVVAATLVFLICLPYVVRIWPVLFGEKQSNLTELTQTLHGGRDAWQRIQFAYARLISARGFLFSWVWPTTLFFAAVSSFTAAGRRLFLPLGIPLFLLWAIGFSYELRTVAMLLPILSLAAGSGFLQALACVGEGNRRIADKFPRGARYGLAGVFGIGLLVWMLVPIGGHQFQAPFVRWVRNTHYFPWWSALEGSWIACLAAAFGVLAIAWYLARRPIRIPIQISASCAAASFGVLLLSAPSTTELAAKQLERQRTVGMNTVNAKLYAMFGAGELQGQIAGDYYPLAQLPDLKRLYVPLQFRGGFQWAWMQSWLRDHPGVAYLMISENSLSPAAERDLMAAGFRLVFRESGFCLEAVPLKGVGLD